MEEKKTKMNKQFSILSMEVQEQTGSKGICKRIIFNTDIGRVTFSPKDMVISKRLSPQGLPITSIERENMLIADLPELVLQINNLVDKNGSCEVKAQITKWDTIDQQAEPITYLFFSSMEDFKAIKIIK